MLALAAELRDHAITCQLRKHNGEEAAKFVLAGGPCLIPDPDTAGPKPTYVALNYFGVSLELHGGVQFKGQSRARHEVDVSIVRASDVAAVRKKGGGSIPGCPVLAVEVKEIPAHRRLAKNAIRALIGCKIDLYPGWPLDRVSLSFGGPTADYKVTPRYVRFALVTTGILTKQSRRLGEFYGMKLFEKIEHDNFECIEKLAGWVHEWAAIHSVPTT
jgi:hypothetical protein